MAGGGFVGQRCVLAGLALAALALIGPTAAGAAKGKANLRVAQLERPPATIAPGDPLTVKGKVVNRGKRAAAAKVTATLSSRPAAKKGSVRLGRTTTAPVRPEKQRRFRIAGGLPASLAPGQYYLVACVRKQGRKGKAVCKVRKRAIDVGPDFTPGGRSLGDELFPQIGNGGYDALHYTIELDYDPVNNVFKPGTATTIRARATQNLSEFSLDFQDLDVTEVTVDGVPASFEQIPATPALAGGTQPWKLVVVPAAGIEDGAEFQVRIEYEGEPVKITDPDGAVEGWIPACTSGGACDGAFVVNEPIGAQGWFPSNNFPTDKATFDTRITVPDGKVAFGVGELVSNEPNGDGTVTWSWSEDDPTATYLATATTGDFDFTERTITEAVTERELPLYEGIDVTASTSQVNQITTSLGRTEDMINFLSARYGFYPFDSGGAVVDVTTGVGYALEVQTKPHYSSLFVSEGTHMHELAHQWFGNAVTIANWNDLWFQEGWATWSSWAWSHADGGAISPAERFAVEYASTSNPTRWNTIPTELNGDPSMLFANFPTYTRGALTYEGYRQIVGNAKFFRFARELCDRFAYQNVTSEDVVDLALEMSGLEGERLELLEEYFQQWLYEAGKPAITPDDFTQP